MPDIEIGEEYIDEGEPRDALERIKKLKTQLSQCEKEKKEYLDGWQRAKADLLNARREEAQRLTDWRERLEDSVILELLPVLDSFDLALSANHEKHVSPEAKRGFDLIRLQFIDTFRRLGVQEIKAEGVFNPALHEAVEEVEGDRPPGSIVETLQKGFERNGRILRPARVRIIKLGN